MKRLPLMLLLAAGLVAATAQAQTGSEQPSTPPPVAAGEVAKTTPDAPASAADSDRKRLSDAHCVRETGSRITRRDGKQRCTGQPGRSYSKDDLDRTGHTNIGDALRTLDPAIR